MENDSKFSINRNGIYFNLNLLSDECIENINNYLNEKIILSENNSNKINYEPYIKNPISDTDIISIHKFSNQEKTFIKKFHQNSI